MISLIGHPGAGKRTVAGILATRYDYAIFDVNEPIRKLGKAFNLHDVEHLKQLITREGNALPWVKCLDDFVETSPPMAGIAVLGISSPAEIREVIKRGSAIVYVAGGVNRNGCPYLPAEYAQSRTRLFNMYNLVGAANIGSMGNTGTSTSSMAALVELVEKTVFDINTSKIPPGI
jgi:hypothetical protein